MEFGNCAEFLNEQGSVMVENEMGWTGGFVSQTERVKSGFNTGWTKNQITRRDGNCKHITPWANRDRILKLSLLGLILTLFVLNKLPLVARVLFKVTINRETGTLVYHSGQKIIIIRMLMLLWITFFLRWERLQEFLCLDNLAAFPPCGKAVIVFRTCALEMRHFFQKNQAECISLFSPICPEPRFLTKYRLPVVNRTVWFTWQIYFVLP